MNIGRTIAIVGRPNVGKSSLFNRLTGRRIAIVHESSGVTRDRILQPASWGGETFDLIDTGGLGGMDGATQRGDIEKGIHQQVEAALADAAVVLLMVDLTAGVTPMDQEVARLLRATGRKVLVVANKADTVERDPLAPVFTSLGFPAFPVSVLHNRGLDALMEVALEGLPAESVEAAPPSVRIAIVGRPNAGKSSFINRLLCSDRLIVSEVPGTTRDSVDIPFSLGSGPTARHYVLVDTAGLKKRSRLDTPVELFSAMRTHRAVEEAEVVVMMVDAIEGVLLQERKIGGMIKEARRACIVLVNKWDLVSESTQRTVEPDIRRALAFLDGVPIVFASARTGYNVRRCFEAIDRVAEQYGRQIPTGVLNRMVLDAVERTAPPSKDGRRLKVYYCTQVASRPPRIHCFVNDPRMVTEPFRVFLSRAIARQAGLEGVPVVLTFRGRKKTDRERRPTDGEA